MNPKMIGETAPTPEPNTASVPTPEPAASASEPKEIGGRDGLDPTRYGDWEKNGRCIDF
ncbi:DUF1674 domain-containing protein [Lysobacter sp. CFH 32150]|uniref:DUF1674 domain-containing protein n=1 Tax=Lysobacter sp. CFH 32150 TaxID=2927128 RepID=UPI001FA78D35|nr:DUF1674 domain-containing protein [Lysobacter sp. CFH 32150]